MANAVYPKALEQMLQGGINMSSGTVKAALVDVADYTYSAAHQYYSSVSAAVVGTPQTLATKKFSLGIFNCDDASFSALTGDSVEALVIYVDTGTEATSPLVAYIDTGNGLPFTPTGGVANIVWNASGIFQL
jgi:hypothetical protein